MLMATASTAENSPRPPPMRPLSGLFYHTASTVPLLGEGKEARRRRHHDDEPATTTTSRKLLVLAPPGDASRSR
ncbi:hypothetical protein OsI_20620 [Oryza sativa Indica Group]|uniref:Uncharacterized protein n=1 Tax=Oryza sativa subsp. indica TaxID=39946 RepID=B8AZZ2_ORYSI|nr:hypothetical protein OsI_20620 [Oryza sativa Indica Group]